MLATPQTPIPHAQPPAVVPDPASAAPPRPDAAERVGQDRVAPPPPNPRLGELVGDRCCVGCQFNLAGQTITREPHYGLPIVSCPECRTIAVLQEYPVLSRWVPRIRALLAAGLLIALLSGVLVSAAVGSTFALQLSRVMSQPFSEHVSRVFPSAKNAAQQPDASWWSKQPPERLFAEAGGWTGAIEWRELWLCVPAGVAAALAGMAWAVALPNLRGARRLLVPGAILTFAALLIGMSSFSTRSRGGGVGAWYFARLADQYVRAELVTLILGTLTLALLVGMVIGRPLARAVLVLALPPRLRAPFSFLWRCDGVPLPRP